MPITKPKKEAGRQEIIKTSLSGKTSGKTSQTNLSESGTPTQVKSLERNKLWQLKRNWGLTGNVMRRKKKSRNCLSA